MNKQIANERRRQQRRNVNFYLPVMDSDTQEVIGHMVDISLVGFMMDSKIPVPTNVMYNLHLDFMENVAGRASLDFTGRSKWCRHDLIQPFLYNAGFEFVNLAPGDLEVFKTIAEKYGAK
jgi:hypothetical protein